MEERKPRQMSWQTWIDKQVTDAEQRGVFDDLPGKGKPLNLRDDEDFTSKWIRDYVQRSGESFHDALPAPLRLRKESEQLRLAAENGQPGTQAQLQAAIADLNQRIINWRRLPSGPPLYVKLIDEQEVTAAWRAARDRQAGARTAAPAAAGGAAPPRRRWRLFTRRGQAT